MGKDSQGRKGRTYSPSGCASFGLSRFLSGVRTRAYSYAYAHAHLASNRT